MLLVPPMAFGLKMSQDVFQMYMDQITDILPGIIAIHDGMCIWENKGRTQHTLITANENSIKMS